MIPIHHWARHFSVTEEDIQLIESLLLDKETPLPLSDLAHAVIAHRLQTAATALEDRYRDVVVYSPASTYAVGQHLIFPAQNYATGHVTDARPGNNTTDYGEYSVISVDFDTVIPGERQYAAGLAKGHRLSAEGADQSLPGASAITADDVLKALGNDILPKLDARLRQHDDLVVVAGLWFPKSLILDVNVGHLHLAEAILDMNAGGPMLTEDILTEIGGLNDAAHSLQVLSLNYALNADERFDEVGPAGTVLWFLKRLEPPEVLATPSMLRYTPVEYDRSMLSPEMIALEQEIADEWSDLPEPETIPTELMLTINYPHRRLGTLPLNAGLLRIFPTARRTPRIAVTLVDAQDGEEFSAWAVRADRYVVGINKLYRKHRLPVGAFVIVRPGAEAGKIEIDFRPHKARTEYVRLIVNRDGNIVFEEQKRAIGADYDDLMIFGADDLTTVDGLHQVNTGKKPALASLLKVLIHELTHNNPQGTVHGKTLYSAVNIVRRCPPGPIFTALAAGADFEYMGNNMWKLSANG